ncbi:hypothetical protein MTQ01_04530 [Streptomyces sp. XM4193]|uniref:hypothetical protein n=1 Tax=Streptomyces sp. XM4193 TaxID=2929782 RepID=UPI001FF768CB|nr:hypothetical protein [Streptomyces sp. XM4193]MCK1795285.1 hypothetical protein [Streptomyces sp. XM4193]
MLFPTDFWFTFALVVAAGLIGTIVAAAVAGRLQSGPRRRTTAQAARSESEQSAVGRTAAARSVAVRYAPHEPRRADRTEQVKAI